MSRLKIFFLKKKNHNSVGFGLVKYAVKHKIKFKKYKQDDPGGGDGKELEASDLEMDSTEYVLGKNWRDLIPVIKVGLSLCVCTLFCIYISHNHL